MISYTMFAENDQAMNMDEYGERTPYALQSMGFQQRQDMSRYFFENGSS